MSKYLLLISLIVSSSVFAKIEKELRFPLASSGFRDLLRKGYENKKVRTDYYYDFYSPDGYVLSRLERPIKFRLKVKRNHRYEIAYSKLLNTETYPNNQVQRTIKETDSIKIEISKALGKQLVRLNEEIFMNLKYRNFDLIESKLIKINEYLKEIIKENKLTDLFPYLTRTFIISRKNKKERYSKKIKINGMTLKTKIGRTMEKNRSGFPLSRYEWEGEPKNSRQIPNNIFDQIWGVLDLENKPARFFRTSRSSTGVYYHLMWKTYFER